MTRKNTIEDVWKKINKHPECVWNIWICWEWKGYTTNGYGRIHINGIPYLSHRVVWESIYGSIPLNMCVLHSCDNPKCCNPSHLFLGTVKDNNSDKENKGRGKHPVGEQHGRSKLTEKQVGEIRKLYSTKNYTQETIRKKYGISKGSIYYILKNREWVHI
ncbi:MAG: HNH endonuclease [Candidatus Methanoperedens sp.]